MLEKIHEFLTLETGGTILHFSSSQCSFICSWRSSDSPGTELCDRKENTSIFPSLHPFRLGIRRKDKWPAKWSKFSSWIVEVDWRFFGLFWIHSPNCSTLSRPIQPSFFLLLLKVAVSKITENGSWRLRKGWRSLPPILCSSNSMSGNSKLF